MSLLVRPISTAGEEKKGSFSKGRFVIPRFFLAISFWISFKVLVLVRSFVVLAFIISPLSLLVNGFYFNNSQGGCQNLGASPNFLILSHSRDPLFFLLDDVNQNQGNSYHWLPLPHPTYQVCQIIFERVMVEYPFGSHHRINLYPIHYSDVRRFSYNVTHTSLLPV